MPSRSRGTYSKLVLVCKVAFLPAVIGLVGSALESNFKELQYLEQLKVIAQAFAVFLLEIALTYTQRHLEEVERKMDKQRLMQAIKDLEEVKNNSQDSKIQQAASKVISKKQQELTELAAE